MLIGLGVYATYAGIGLMLAALVVLGALVFELLLERRRVESSAPKPAASTYKPATV